MGESQSSKTDRPAAAGFEIRGGGYRAGIAATGAGLRLLERDGPDGPTALTETWDLGTRPPLSAGLILAPWPNRIRDGRFAFDGIDHQLEITEPGFANASHGFVRRRDWRVVNHADDRIELSIDVGLHKGWPYPLRLTVDYVLGDDGLTVTHTATNTGAIPAPFGMGFHSYVRAGDFPLDECTLRLSAGTRLPLDERMLPSGGSQAVAGTDYDFTSPRTLAGVALDTPFSALDVDVDGRSRHELRAPDGTGTVLWAAREFGWLQAFVADPDAGKSYPGRGRALALEPMTCPPDAFNSGIDQLVLAPGQQWTGVWGMSARGS
ncbi:aldose epimerase [Rhodococcus sp. ACS1]|uniref:Aldose 1-epimerase n=1 Tax=Rhodococcus koreensis TaxID=99653 RepID=A0A1H4S948_9NOCA|nr:MULTISPECIES: aldose 1-epimerase family protein [Rhodococcus]PBC46668.1 aldose epimerase [Rhodococcus sp. ACS1]QSE82647.1 aldose 1-epimerase family protein [Rhodococcus koreensis]SEC40371.1 aldose 1-epimerase [Rhodococcus koreensis]